MHPDRASAGVVISTYNRPRALDLVLSGISAQSEGPAEVLIADDGSTQETRKVVDSWRSLGLPIQHFWHEDRGFRKARILNQAIANSKASILIFLDGDCVPFESFVKDHLDYSEPGFVLAGRRILASREFTLNIENTNHFQLQPGFLYWLRKRLQGQTNRWWPLARIRGHWWRKFRQRDWRALRGCNFSAYRDDLIRINGFDQLMEGWGREDSDLAVRLINSNIGIKSLSFAAPVLHLWHKEESRSSLNRNDRYLSDSLSSGRTSAISGLHESINHDSRFAR